MPLPLTPSEVKALLPQATGSKCSQFEKLLAFPTVLHALVSYAFKEDGTPTDEFAADICALDCFEGGVVTPPPNPSMPAPNNVQASDGTYSDKVRITWQAVTPPAGISAVTNYLVYRALSTITNPNSASLIATVAAPTVQYDDTTATPGSIFRYWLKATNGTQTSTFSGSDLGNADEPTEVIDTITDLLATQGFSDNDSAPVTLQWTPPAGATHYDIYRHTANDFGAATLIMEDMVPQNSADHFNSTTSPDQVWDCTERIVAFHFPPSGTVHYFFWVVAKKNSPPGISAESNAAEGWVRSFYAPYLGVTPLLLNQGDSKEEGVDFTGVNIRVVLIGSGGGGAGGSQIWGGGGGGSGGVVVEEFVLSAGDIISLEASPAVDETGNAPALTNGDDGADMLFKINGVTKMIANGGLGGQYESSGQGQGGNGESGSGTTTPTVYDGFNGRDGSGAAGGQSGFRFGTKRYPASHYDGYGIGSWDGDAGVSGSSGGGAYAAPGTEVLAVGGNGRTGYAVVVYGA